jgi:hypothetical protein
VRISTQTIIVAAAVSLASSVASAASQSVDVDKLPMERCSTIHYGKAFLEKHPKAPAACMEVRVYEGHRYMKVQGKVYIVDKDSLTVAFLDEFGNDLGTVTIKGQNAPSVIFNGKKVGFTALQTGEKLTFWVPESVFSAESSSAGS